MQRTQPPLPPARKSSLNGLDEVGDIGKSAIDVDKSTPPTPGMESSEQQPEYPIATTSAPAAAAATAATDSSKRNSQRLKYGASGSVATAMRQSMARPLPAIVDPSSPRGKRNCEQRLPQRNVTLCCGVLFTIFLTLIGFMLVVYFDYFVAPPWIEVFGIVQPKDGLANSIKIDLGDPGKRKPGVTMSLLLDVGVYSKNHFDMLFPFVKVQGSLMVLPDYVLGETNVTDVFVPREGNTTMIVPITLRYSMDNDPEALIVKDLISACTLKKGADKPDKDLEPMIMMYPKAYIIPNFVVVVPKAPSPTYFGCPFVMSRVFKIGPLSIDISKIDWVALGRGELKFST